MNLSNRQFLPHDAAMLAWSWES